MHHFIFPLQDTYITNRPKELDTKNFGVDEILQVGTQNALVSFVSPTTNYPYNYDVLVHVGLQNFNGTFTGSITGTDATSSYAYLNGSGSVISASYFSGSNNSGSINGVFSGSFEVDNFVGTVATGSTVCLYGTASGVDIRQQQSQAYVSQSFADRSLLMFDLAAISQSIVNGDIVNPSFRLKVKVCSEYQLPNAYTIYIYPISQSWAMGTGYMSDGGSDDGASWVYRDGYNGALWDVAGGTYVSELSCSQSFRYETSDIDVDVTSIVNAWLNGSIENNGLILVSSDEFHSTGSGFVIKYFSEDTNTIYSPVLDVAWDDSVFITGSIQTSSVVVTQVSGSNTTIASGSTLTGAGGVHGNFKASAFVNVTSVSESYAIWNGFISGQGFTGNINGVPVIGQSFGLLNTGSVVVNLPDEIHYLAATSPMESPYMTPTFPATDSPYTYLNLEYVWGGDEVGWSSTVPIPPNATITSSCGVSHSVQLMTGQLSDGALSGSTFTAYYENYRIIFADLTGSWTEAALLGSSVVIPFPQASYPYVNAFVNGTYVQGQALGLYQVYGPDSASFSGQFIGGPLMGAYCNFQLTGSSITASFAYTSSINVSASVMTPLDVSRPFSINLQSLQPEYKSGDIIKINVFGRKKFPLKDFGILTQQYQYLVPEFLPFSSSWALKDNQTDEIVVNFDTYTRISCAYPEGNFFLVDTTGLPQERYYRILIRVEANGIVDTVDTGKTFKITR